MFRSVFDPLPRFLSTRSLFGIVAAVLVGTAVMVHGYLKSTEPLAQAPRIEAETWPAPSEAPKWDVGRRDVDRWDDASIPPAAPKPFPATSAARPARTSAPARKVGTAATWTPENESAGSSEAAESPAPTLVAPPKPVAGA